MALAPVFIVQCTDSGLFLCPYEGDVGYTKLLRDAGRFYDADAAFETAMFNLGPNFVVTQFFEHVQSGH